MTATLLPWMTKPFKNGIISYRKKESALGGNKVFSLGADPNEKCREMKMAQLLHLKV